MSVILATTVNNTVYYIRSTSVRQWDNRKLINLTKDAAQAKTFHNDFEAQQFLTKCVTNGRRYVTEPLQKA